MMVFDPTKPVRTAAGDPARIICTDRQGRYPIVALVTIGGAEDVRCYSTSGQHNGFAAGLVNIPEKIEGYVNVYRGGDGRVWPGMMKASRTEADEHCTLTRIARLKISFEEGQFDD